MTNPSIRGHQGKFLMYQNGALVDVQHFTSIDVNMDSDFSRSEYAGSAIPEGDQSIRGWSGTAELEVKNANAEDFIDALINNNLNGIGVSDYSFIITENYPDGSSRSYVYTDVQWKLSRRQSGLAEKVTKRLEFQASYRQALN